MKKILLLIFFSTIVISNAGEKNLTIDIYVPRTLSSIPVMELDNILIDNFKIKVHTFDDHIMSMAEFIKGKFPVLMTGFSLGLTYYLASNDVVMVATPVWGVSSLVSTEEQFTNLADFSGKRILVPFAKSPLELQLKAILKNENLLDRVIIDYAPIGQQVGFLLAGKAEGICVPEPLASKLILEKKAYEVFSFSEKWKEINDGDGRSPQVSLFTKKSFAKINAAFLRNIVKKLIKNINYIDKNPKELSLKYRDVFQIDNLVIERALEKVIFDLPESATGAELCRKYQEKIGNTTVIDEKFFFNY
ncbi:MAG: ABC transporter substrate-binding protein [Spirochaetes bacterium]|nr:ABC transporter substrate-binding protein [Spirochaetota bacterium]